MSVTTPDTFLPMRDRPWGLATLWLILVGGFFFVSYLGSLELVALRDDVPVLVFEWERHIPFLAWTIVPYWSIDLFYALAFFLCLTRAELFGLVRRLLSAQVIAVTIFLIAPLKLTSTIPADTGIFAAPEGGATAAAVPMLLERGMIDSSDEVVPRSGRCPTSRPGSTSSSPSSRPGPPWRLS